MKSEFEINCDKDTGICTARLRVGIWKSYPIGTDLVGTAIDARVAGREYLGFGLPAEITSINKEKRTADFIASTSKKDRLGDEIVQDGWELKNYHRNPVHLFAHDSRSLPIGKAIKTVLERNQLVQRIQYTPVRGFDLPDVVFQLIVAGSLRGISVGFVPLEFEFLEDGSGGRRFVRQELLETSIVPIPANPQALVTGKTFAAGEFGLSGVPQVELEIAERRNLDPAEEVLTAMDEDDDEKQTDPVLEDLIKIIQETPDL